MNTLNANLLNTAAATIGLTTVLNLFPIKHSGHASLTTISAAAIETTAPERSGFQSATKVSFSIINMDKLILSPNPNNGYFIVHLPPGIGEEKGMIEIIDLAGNKVYSTVLTPDIGDKLDIDLTGKASGMYFLVLITPNDRQTQRFVIH